MSRATLVTYLAIGATAAALLPGCGSERKSEPITGAPLELDEQALRGQVLFMKRCNECHPQGEAAIGPSLNDKPTPAVAIRAQVRNGLGAMPAFSSSEISDGDLDAIVAYMIAVRRHGE